MPGLSLEAWCLAINLIEMICEERGFVDLRWDASVSEYFTDYRGGES